MFSDFILFELEKCSKIISDKIHYYRTRKIKLNNRLPSNNIKLDLGCGGAKKKGYIGIDTILGPGVDIQQDITEGIPFNNDSVSSIYMSHVLEHIPNKKINYVLSECFRVLKSKGNIIIEVPNLEKVLKIFLKSNESKRWGNIWKFIFGNQRNEFEFHKTGFSKKRITDLLRKTGFLSFEINEYMEGEIPSIKIKAAKP